MDQIRGKIKRLRLLRRCSPFLPWGPCLDDEFDTARMDSTGMETGRGLPAEPAETHSRLNMSSAATEAVRLDLYEPN